MNDQNAEQPNFLKRLKKDKRSLSSFTHSDVIALIVEFGVLGVLVILFSLNLFESSPKNALERITEQPSLTTSTEETLSTTTETQQGSATGTNKEPATQVDRFADLTLKADSVYVWDMKEKRVLYEKNSYAEHPLASITKIMSAIVAREHLPSDTLIHVDQRALLAEGSSGLIEGENWSLENILEVSLVSSSNDAAAAIASVAGSLINSDTSHDNTPPQQTFVNKMNEKANELGLSNTRFYNPHGLDLNPQVSGAYGTARDTAKLLEYAIQTYPSMMESTARSFSTVHSLEDREQPLTNTNQVITDIPGVFASKTGYTDLAGGNLAIAFDAGLNHPVAIVVLGSTYEGRFEDMVKLVNATINTFAAHDNNTSFNSNSSL